jgi:hypothetical protein
VTPSIYTADPHVYFSAYSRDLFTVSETNVGGKPLDLDFASGNYSAIYEPVAAACAAMSGCVGFDSEGWIKSMLSLRRGPPLAATAADSNPCAFVALRR